MTTLWVLQLWPVTSESTRFSFTVCLTIDLNGSLDETFKACAYSWETLQDPSYRVGEPSESPVSKALGVKETLWQHYARPEYRYRGTRFDIGMHGVNAMQPADSVLKGTYILI
jgi:hypothetical protein